MSCLKRKEKEEADEISEATAVMEKEMKGESTSGCSDHQAMVTEIGSGKKRRHSDSRKEHLFGGGFVGNLHLSESSSDSSAEESENRNLDKNKRRKIASKTETADHKKNYNSSSGEDEELRNMILVTAKPVFKGRKQKSQSKGGRKKRRS